MPTRFGFVWRYESEFFYRLEIWDRTETEGPLEVLVVDVRTHAGQGDQLSANQLIVDLARLRAETSGDELLERAAESLETILFGSDGRPGRIELGSARPPFHFHATPADFPSAPATAFQVLQAFPESREPVLLRGVLDRLQVQLIEIMSVPPSMLGGQPMTIRQILESFLASPSESQTRVFDQAPECGVEPTENRQEPESIDHAVGLATSLHDEHVYEEDMVHARDNQAALRAMVDAHREAVDDSVDRGRIVVHGGNAPPRPDQADLATDRIMIDDPHGSRGPTREAVRAWYESVIGYDMAAAVGEYSAVVHSHRDAEGRTVITHVVRRRRESPGS